MGLEQTQDTHQVDKFIDTLLTSNKSLEERVAQLETNEANTALQEFLANQFPQSTVMWHDQAKVLTGNALARTIDNSQPYNTYSEQAAAANGDTFEHSFILEAGTYTFKALGIIGTNRGINNWYVDDVLIVTGQDWYNGSLGRDAIKSQASVVIADSKRHVLKSVVTGKNGASSDYKISLTKYWFEPADYTAG